MQLALSLLQKTGTDSDIPHDAGPDLTACLSHGNNLPHRDSELPVL